MNLKCDIAELKSLPQSVKIQQVVEVITLLINKFSCECAKISAQKMAGQHP